LLKIRKKKRNLYGEGAVEGEAQESEYDDEGGNGE
jgi:hypothetical protein